MLTIIILSGGCIILFVLNVYQYLSRTTARRLAEVVYIISRNVAERATEVNQQQKDVEIIEAQLHDVVTSTRTLLTSLGYKEEALGPDPLHSIFNGSSSTLSKDSLLQLADRLLFSAKEKLPDATENEIAAQALKRFMDKVPAMDRAKAEKVIDVVARQNGDAGMMSGMTGVYAG